MFINNLKACKSSNVQNSYRQSVVKNIFMMVSFILSNMKCVLKYVFGDGIK